MENINHQKVDTAAVLCRKVKSDSNSYVLIPEEVVLGTINDSNVFISEGGKYIPSGEDKKALEDDFLVHVYMYPVLLQSLKFDFLDSRSLMFGLFHYYRDTLQNVIQVDKRGNEKPINQIQNTVIEEPKKTISVSNLAVNTDSLEHLSHIDNFALEKYVKERVFDADDIIEDICTTIAMNYSAKNSKEMKTMLSIGPTGSGKTMTYQVIAEYLGIPLTIYDCNNLTAAGYVGKDIEDALREVYFNSDKKKEVSEKSILVFDEVDKLADRGSDVKDSSVQQAMLKLLEGFKYSFQARKNGPEISLDTSFMTIACLGAFSSIFENKRRKHGLGFNPEKEEELYTVTDEELVEYGMIRELVGRWKHLFVYQAQTEESLRRILLESKWSPLLLQKERYLRQFNAELIWDTSFIDAYISEAFKKNSGGRSLSKIGANTFVKVDRELLRENLVNPHAKKKVLVTHETIYDNKNFKI